MFSQAASSWEIQEIYSNEDGSIQFIELFSSSPETLDSLNGVSLVSTSSSGASNPPFTFPSNSGTKTEQHILLAAPAFAALPGGITPDYEISFNFLFTEGGTLDLDADSDPVPYGPPPPDNMALTIGMSVESWDRNGIGGPNSPTNFVPETGNLTQNSYVIFDEENGILRMPVVDVRDTSGVTVSSAILQQVSGSPDTFELISSVPSGRTESDPGFLDNPSYDETLQEVIFPFVAVDKGVDTERWYTELEYISPTDPMQFRLIPPKPISPGSTTQTHHYHPTIKIFLEMNIENTLAWVNVPLQVTRNGRDHTLESIYRDVGIDLIHVQNAPVADLRVGARAGQPYTDAELLQFQQDNIVTNPPPLAAADRWHIYGSFVPEYQEPDIRYTTLGVMFTNNCCPDPMAPSLIIPAAEIRTGFAVFAGSISTLSLTNILVAESYLRTTAHELGHALNLLHEDGDNPPDTTIMKQTVIAKAGTGWDYWWSDNSFAHLNRHPLDRIEPGLLAIPATASTPATAYDFLECHDTDSSTGIQTVRP